jgi:hypothetical protein
MSSPDTPAPVSFRHLDTQGDWRPDPIDRFPGGRVDLVVAVLWVDRKTLSAPGGR